MARNWRVRMRRGVMWAIVVLLLGGWTLRVAGASGGDDTAPMAHVRSTNAVIAGAIVEAQSRSSTFRSLVRTIDATDGIVYVERGTCRHGVSACLSLSVVSAGGFRLLRILISHVEDVVSLIATIGHELFHAIEVLSEPARHPDGGGRISVLRSRSADSTRPLRDGRGDSGRARHRPRASPKVIHCIRTRSARSAGQPGRSIDGSSGPTRRSPSPCRSSQAPEC